MTEYVLDLRQVGRGDLDRAGGKAANLGELIHAGFRVPAGFVVTTAAYDRFVAHSHLGEAVARMLRERSGEGAAIRAAFEGAPIPAEVERAVLAAAGQLGRGPVAVRSSATAEDLPEAAFAGQQDTFLNVIGTDALLDAVRRCWASLWTDRSIAYRQRQGIDQGTVKLAIVVQHMVAADAAGVLFTANPVTGARDETVVDASPGLGEAVVSGLVTPDHFILRKGRWRWRVVERRLGRREVVMRARAGGGTEHAPPLDWDEPEPALPDRALRELARVGAAIQRHFGAPQDVEWARAGGKLFVVQARPITALPRPLPHRSILQRWPAALAAELLPVRPFPLEFTTWGPDLLVSALLARMVGLLGLELRPRNLFVIEDGVVVRFSGEGAIHPTPRIALAPLRLLRQVRRYDPARWRADPLLAEAQARARALEARDLTALPWDALLATVHEALAIPSLIGELRARYIPRAALAAARLRLALALLGHGDTFLTLLLTGVTTRTVEANLALEALAARIRSDPSLASAFATHEPGELWAVLEAQPSGRAFLEELRTFLDEYGHREAGGTLLVSQSTWKDAPEVVLGILEGLVLAEARPQPERAAWVAARDEVLSHPLLRFRPLRSGFLGLLTKARWLPQLREDTRFYATLILPVLGRTLLELGRRLASAGVLDTPRDVFHLTLGELEAVRVWPPPRERAEELGAIVAQRKAKRAALEGTPLVDARLFREAARTVDALVQGTPGSPGTAEGPVRVVRDGSDFAKLRSGDILVAPYTNPAWTPLFQRAAAVVVDSGGPGSHAAIVAREYGIPAVMATVDGTRRLADGQPVRVDGSAGLVIGLNQPAATERSR